MEKTGRFKKLDDGWVKDILLGLDWGPSSEETMDFKSAQEYCEKLGVRLPESSELMSLIDHSTREPASFLEDMKYDDWYWTDTPVAGCPEGAWCVYFDGGYVDSSHKDFDNYVRPVRASQRYKQRVFVQEYLSAVS